MNYMSNKINPGDNYLHFKGTLYEVICVAKHTEENGDMVVYKSVNTGMIYARPLIMFISPVDKKKYPECKQEMRFEKIPR